jgi:hypothetical protein
MKTAVKYLSYVYALEGAIYQDDIDKAIEMEKEQIIKACNDTIKSVELDNDKTGFIAQTGEGYYNEKYKDATL